MVYFGIVFKVFGVFLVIYLCIFVMYYVYMFVMFFIVGGVLKRNLFIFIKN